MSNFPHLPASSSDFISLANDCDYLYLMLVDITGTPRVKVFQSRAAEILLTDGTPISMSVFLGRDSENASDDICIRPIPKTARKCSWLGQHTNSRVVQVFAVPEWLSGGIISADPREMAAFQLKRLHDRGLDIQSAIQCEFCLLKAETCLEDEPSPAHGNPKSYHWATVQQYEHMFVECDRRLKTIGIQFDSFHNGRGAGKASIQLSLEWGIKAVDDLVRLKMIVQQVAEECGFKASFMTKVFIDQAPSGSSLKLAVWEKDGENVMFDGNDVDKLSVFARQWIAGLLCHCKALTAIWSPTVNCYRRLHKPFGVGYVDWNTGNGNVAIHVTNFGTPPTTFVENRCPSSAANPYLVLATTIAAGLDGVDRNLELIDEGSRKIGRLPSGLTQALMALKKDEFVCSVLGEQFIDWYADIKVNELTQLESIDISQEKRSDYKKERRLYFENA